MRPVYAFFLVLLSLVPAQAQFNFNSDTSLACNNIGRDRPLSCEIRETSLGPSGSLDIEPGRNGSVIVKGWNQNNVLVRARVEVWAQNDSDARTIASQINVDAAGGRIRASGPDLNNDFLQWDRGRYWSVSLEVFTPFNTDLKTSSHNGSLSISEIRGRIDFETHNGSIRLARVAGDVTGETHNGSINVELAGSRWDGRQLQLSTHNGSVMLAMPSTYSANLETRTDRGRVDSDFPVNVRGRIDQRDLSFSIGSGGPTIRVSTHNGGIRLRRM